MLSSIEAPGKNVPIRDARTTDILSPFQHKCCPACLTDSALNLLAIGLTIIPRARGYPCESSAFKAALVEAMIQLKHRFADRSAAGHGAARGRGLQSADRGASEAPARNCAPA
jgi:hypothetical protein